MWGRRMGQMDDNKQVLQDSMEYRIKRINELGKAILESCREQDSLNSEIYSHEEMFQLLEHYLRLLPRSSKEEDIKDFL